MRYIIGSISHGTLNTSDLLEVFADTLETLARNARTLKHYRKEIREARTVDPESEEATEIVRELEDMLSALAPPYFYFGAHPGDGSDFGFWLSQDALADFDGLRVADLSEVPKSYSGEVLHVNDHGNTSLYAYSRGRGREVWAVV